MAKSPRKASCDELPYADKNSDLVISIAAIHNLDTQGVKKSLREILLTSIRGIRRHASNKVDGYHTQDHLEALYRWNIIAKAILHVDEWKRMFAEVGYTSDYFWFTP